MKTFFIKTYGCQMNVYDSYRIQDVLASEYKETQDMSQADIIIINTCAVREKAAIKMYSDLGRIRKIKKSSALVVVCGCMAQAHGEAILHQAQVHVIVGPQTFHRLPQHIKTYHKTQEPVVDLDFPQEDKFDALPEEKYAQGPVSFLAIQEGCDKFCHFCLVPFTRGAEFSRPGIDILKEAERLIHKGAKELVLLGQNVNGYHGKHPDTQGEWRLGHLIQALAARFPQLYRLRYTTSHPRDVTPDLIQAHAQCSMLMPVLHLPVQSGSTRMLQAMNRRHTREEYIDIIQSFKTLCPDMAFTSDFIVGYPGETDQDFQDTLSLVDHVQYITGYAFVFSPREGTPAAKKPMVDAAVSKKRLDVLLTKLRHYQHTFNQSMEGQTLDILIERPGRHENQWIGRSPYMQSVYVTDKTVGIGQKIFVKIVNGHQNSLEGTVLH